MSPMYNIGDLVITCKIMTRVKPGDVLVLEHPVFKRTVKQVLKVVDGCYLVTGLNVNSHLQPIWVKPHQVTGKLILKLGLSGGSVNKLSSCE